MEQSTEKSLEKIVLELKTNPEAPVPLLLNEIGMKLLDGSDESGMAEKYLILMVKSSCFFEQSTGLFYLLVCDKELSKEAYDTLNGYVRDVKNKEVYSATMKKVGDYFATQPQKIC